MQWEGISIPIPFPLQHDPPPPEAPVPTGAVWNGFTSTLTVSFDRPLQAATLDASNWRMTAESGGSGSLHVPTGALSSGDAVALSFGAVSGTVVSVQYSPPPFDVVGVNGSAAEAFVLPV